MQHLRLTFISKSGKKGYKKKNPTKNVIVSFINVNGITKWSSAMYKRKLVNIWKVI